MLSRGKASSRMSRHYPYVSGDLPAGEAKAVYRQGTYDLRRYRRLSFSLMPRSSCGDPIGVQDGDFELTKAWVQTTRITTMSMLYLFVSLQQVRIVVICQQTAVWSGLMRTILTWPWSRSRDSSVSTMLSHEVGVEPLYQRYTQQETNDPTRRLTSLGSLRSRISAP